MRYSSGLHQTLHSFPSCIKVRTQQRLIFLFSYTAHTYPLVSEMAYYVSCRSQTLLVMPSPMVGGGHQVML